MGFLKRRSLLIKRPDREKAPPNVIFEELSIYFYLRSSYIISRLRFCFFQMMMAM